MSDAVISVDAQLSVGGPASSDCWNNGIAGAKCYGGHLRPTAAQLLSAPSENWALGLVNWGAQPENDARVDFASSHGYSTPCGNATSLFREFSMFHEVIGRSARPATKTVITEWSSNPDPAGVNCVDVYTPGQPTVRSYHDTAAQASFATKTVWLIDGMLDLMSHWAFSGVFEEQGWTWDVFDGGFGLVNRWGVRKPVSNFRHRPSVLAGPRQDPSEALPVVATRTLTLR